MSRQFEDKIRKLAKIRIKEEFKSSLKQDLMERVAMNKPDKSVNFDFSFSNIIHPKMVLKHAYAVVAIAVFLFCGSSALAMKAASDSLPGDFLYSVKRVAEKAQVSLTLNQASKAKRQVGLAGNRVQELAMLTNEETTLRPGSFDSAQDRSGSSRNQEINNDETKNELNAEVIERTVQDFNDEIANVGERLGDLDEAGSEDAIETAKVVDEKTGELADALTEVAEQEELPAEIKQKIVNAINILDEVSSQALGLMLKEYEEGADFEVLVKRLEDKILAAEERITNVDEIVAGQGLVEDEQGILLSMEKKVELARIILSEARDSLNNEDLEMTLQKVEESRELTDEVSSELADAETTDNTEGTDNTETFEISDDTKNDEDEEDVEVDGEIEKLETEKLGDDVDDVDNDEEIIEDEEVIETDEIEDNVDDVEEGTTDDTETPDNTETAETVDETETTEDIEDDVEDEEADLSAGLIRE